MCRYMVSFLTKQITTKNTVLESLMELKKMWILDIQRVVSVKTLYPLLEKIYVPK